MKRNDLDTQRNNIHTKTMDSQNSTEANFQTQQASHIPKILLIVVIIFGFITAFSGGYFLHRELSIEKNVPIVTIPQNENPAITPIPPPSQSLINNPEIPQDTTKFLPGKYYFDDTILIITKDKPHLAIVASVTRTEQDKNYIQNTRVSFFDGTNWTRQANNKTIADSTIVSSNLVKSWNVTIDPSRVLKQTAQGEITINNKNLIFSTGTLQNEIGMRSLPGYTKFLSRGNGTITMDGTQHDIYILYTRIYSLSASEIQFYSQPFGLTTDWLAFWDEEGNFYHVDATDVSKPTQIYQTHKIGIFEDVNGGITKTFQASIMRDTSTPPTTYTITLQDPLNIILKFNRVNAVNKAPNNSYKWFMGTVEGNANINGKTINGVGLIEYIND